MKRNDKANKHISSAVLWKKVLTKIKNFKHRSVLNILEHMTNGLYTTRMIQYEYCIYGFHSTIKITAWNKQSSLLRCQQSSKFVAMTTQIHAIGVLQMGSVLITANQLYKKHMHLTKTCQCSYHYQRCQAFFQDSDV